MWWITLVISVFGLSSAHAQWWTNAVYYRVLVDSFKDADGDGLGDLRGLKQQISYVKALGADAVILSPIVSKSPDCSKPGTLDFAKVDPRYGSLEDFNNFIEKAKKNPALKVVITLPVQTISTASEWFNSSSARDTGYENMLVWRDGKDMPAPDEYGVWVWSPTRNGYYLETNSSEAVLNLCSEAVAESLAAAQCEWIKRGVAGILLNPDFKQDRDCGVKFLSKMAAVAQACARAANVETPAILVESFLSSLESASYYKDDIGIGAFSVLSNAVTAPAMGSAPGLALAFHAALLSAPQDMVPTWQTSAPSTSLITSRYGTEMIDAINLLILFLPGAAIIQQGDELGISNTIVEWASEDNCWPNVPLPSSAPFPWDDTTNGGFTSGKPWLPLSQNSRYANVKAELSNDMSHIGMFRMIIALRNSTAMGPNYEIIRLNSAVAVYRWGNEGSLLAVVNVAKEHTLVHLSRIAGAPNRMSVVATGSISKLSAGAVTSLEKTLKLEPGEAIVLSGGPRHCGGPGPVDKIASKLAEGWQKINNYFS